MAIPSIMHY